MDAFESLIAMLLWRDGFWTTTSFKVDLTKEEKRAIGLPSTPRWEIDVVAYQGQRNEIMAVECKSFLDSPGVKFRNGGLQPPRRYKMFCNAKVSQTVLERLSRQLQEIRAVRKSPKITLALAVGKFASKSDEHALREHFEEHDWRVFGPDWIKKKLDVAAGRSYENDIAHVVAKLILRDRQP